MSGENYLSIKKDTSGNFILNSGDFYTALGQIYLNTKILFDILDDNKEVIELNGFTGLENILRYLIIENLKVENSSMLNLTLDFDLEQYFMLDNGEYKESSQNKFELNIRYCESFYELIKFFINFLAILSSEFLKDKNELIGSSELNSYLDILFEDTKIEQDLYNLLYQQYNLVYNLK